MTSNGGPAEQATPEQVAQEWQRILSYVLGNHAAWIIDIGLRSGLLERVAAIGPVPSDRLAESLGFDAGLTATWARAAYAYSIMEWSDPDGYALSEPMRRILLDSADPQFLGGRVQFYTALYEDFRAFPQFLRSGDRWPRSAHDPWLLVALANLSRPDAVMLTTHAIPQAPRAEQALRDGGALLEIGPGAGEHAIHYARTYPAARIVGLDVDPASIALARDAIGVAGVGDRVTIREADANELDEIAAYDLVVANITLHETGDETSWANVARRSFQALRPGGSFLVSELPYPDSVADYRSSPVYQMLAGVQLHEAIVGCGAITQGGLVELLRAAGFSDVRVVDQPIRTRHVVLGDRAPAELETH